MKKNPIRTIVVFTGCIILWGCSSTSTVTSARGPGALSYDDFNTQVRDEDVSILFQNDRTVAAKNVSLRQDTLFWTDPAGSNLSRAHVSTIRAISKGPNRLSGGIAGFLIGGALGGVIGASIGGKVTAGEDHNLHVLIGAAAGATAGGFLGGLAGIASAQDRIYIINPAPTK
ncbi:MAG TPA: hypothetical protein VL633_05925 [Bacteroidota bacterium]|jgi:hypothetical protein|nr:hypothetical protein [Bacteroidota bacterium]